MYLRPPRFAECLQIIVNSILNYYQPVMKMLDPTPRADVSLE